MAERKLVYVPDVHAPYHDKQAVETALKIIHWYKPDRIVVIGDFLDYAPCSRFLADSVAERAAVSMQDEFDAGNQLLDRLMKHCQDLVFHNGNHEDRAYQYIDKHPEVRGLIEVDKGLHFKERRKAGATIRHLKYNECHKEGNLYSTHGWYTNVNHPAKHVQAFGRSLLYGHCHSMGSAVAISPIDVRKKHIAMCIGCLCNQNPGYMRNAPSSWVHCVTLATVRDNGDFNVYPVIISDGVASFGGKTFSS